MQNLLLALIFIGSDLKVNYHPLFEVLVIALKLIAFLIKFIVLDL